MHVLIVALLVNEQRNKSMRFFFLGGDGRGRGSDPSWGSSKPAYKVFHSRVDSIEFTVVPNIETRGLLKGLVGKWRGVTTTKKFFLNIWIYL